MEDRDPSSLTDEELDAVLAGGDPEPATVQPPEKEVTPAPDPQPDPDPEPTPDPEPQLDPDPEEAPVRSRRESLRIAKLVERELQQRQNHQAPQNPTALNYADKLEVDNPQILQDLENDRRTVSDQAYQAGIRQAETISWKSSLRMESPIVESKYTFLNPKDPQNFNPAAADAMNQKYLRYVGYNPGSPQQGVPESVQIPDVSYMEFVEAEMEFADEIARNRVENTTRNIAKQAASTGLRPDGSRAKRMDLNKDPEMMTDEELDARISQAVPTKR